MKILFSLFMIISITSVQVMAMDCGLNCFAKSTIEKMVESEHACCHEETDSKDKNCMEEMNGICFHSSIQNIFSELRLKSFPLIYITLSFEINNGLPKDIRYLPKIPDQFQKFKSQRSLFLIKEQFLI